MSNYRIITVQFDHKGRDDYRRLLEVFLYSAKKHMPHVAIEIIKSEPPQKRDDRNTGLVNNTAKAGLWIAAMERAKPGTNLMFMDCDLLVLGDMTEAFRLHKFDLAYTTRATVEHGKHRIPINGGVMFVRNNEKSIAFMKKWREINDAMYMDPAFHRPWRDKYAGMNQSAFGYMLETPGIHECQMLALPCARYNLCNTEWHLINQGPLCIHIKSKLRRACLGQSGLIAPLMREPMRIWRAYEREMKAMSTIRENMKGRVK